MNKGVSVGDVQLFRSDGRFHYAHLLQGREAESVSEVVISQQLAQELGIKLGENLNCDKEDLQVVGISVRGAVADELYAVLVHDYQDLSNQVENWLTDKDLDQDPDLGMKAMTGAIRSNSVQSNTAYKLKSVYGNLVTISASAAAVLMIALAIMLSVAGILIQSVSKSVGLALQAIGISQKCSWIMTVGPAILVLYGACLCGALASKIIFLLFGQQIASTCNQVWFSTANTSVLVAAYLLITLLAAATLILIFTWLKSRHRTKTGLISSGSHFPTLKICILGIVIFLIGMLGYFLVTKGISQIFFFSLIAMVIGICFLGVVVAWAPVAYPLRRAGHYTSAPALVLAPVVGVIALLFTMLGTSLYMSGMASKVDSSGSDAYLSVLYLSSADVEVLKERFPQVMADAVIVAVPEESDYNVRIATEAYKECSEKANDFCQDWIDLMGFVLPDSPGQDLVGKASPELATAQSGSTYYLNLYNPETLENISFIPVEVSKTVDNRLGQAEMPGWIAAWDDPVLRAAGVKPGGNLRIYIHDMSAYPDKIQTQFRNLASSISGSAVINESQKINTASLVKLSYGTFAFSFFLVVAIMGMGLSASGKLRQSLLFVVSNYGGGKQVFRRIYFAHLFPYLLAVFTGAIVAYFCTPRAVGGRGSVPKDVSPGYSWLIVPVFLAILSTCLAWWSSRRASVKMIKNNILTTE